MKTRTMNRILFLPILITLGCQSGNGSKKDNQLPYDINSPSKVISLPADLNEISGIAYSAADDYLYAIADEDGILYRMNLEDGNLAKYQFAKKGDYEDLVVHGQEFFVLESNGKVNRFSVNAGSVTNALTFNFEEKGKNEFESLYHDDRSGRLVLLCKECKGSKNGAISTFTVNVKDGSVQEGEPFKGTIKTKDPKPAAVAIHPKTKELYILSSANKLLFVATPGGKIVATYPLNPTLFKQPEGITFLPDGEMVISNERNETGSAQLLRFPYKMVQKKSDR